MDLPNTITSAVTHARRRIRQRIAILWHFAYRVQYSLGQYRVRYGSITLFGVLLLLVSASIYLWPSFQAILEAYYATEAGIQGLQALLLNTGAALIGAAAIVTSLVLFAMQVNIERMPYGLFRRLSADPKLLGAFAGAFLLAISVTALSTFVEQSRLALVLLSAVWSVLFVWELSRIVDGADSRGHAGGANLAPLGSGLLRCPPYLLNLPIRGFEHGFR